MNTEINQEDNESMTTGARLRQARERLGLSQRMVAERLCLMLSTVRDIEEDKLSPRLAATFVRGYIRSYAKLVQLPEEELLSLLAPHAAARMTRIAPMQSFSFAKKRKKRDNWLMMFTWLVVIVIIGLTGAWWWQNYQAQQQEIRSMARSQIAETQSVEQPATAPEPGASQIQQHTQPWQGLTNRTPSVSVPWLLHGTEKGQEESLADTQVATPAPAIQSMTPQEVLQEAARQVQSQIQEEEQPPEAAINQELVITFTADCWIEVQDATGHVLVSALKHKGSTLELAGKAPYKLKLGVPSAVQIVYQGSPVDLGSIASSQQVTRLTIPAP